MFHKFYGLTAVNIVLTNMPLKLYVRCIENLKNNPEILLSLSKQFDNIESFISSIPDEYVDPKDKRIVAKMRILEKSNPSDPKIEEMREYLKTRPRDIASFLYVNGERVEISDLSKSIILKLKSSRDSIKRYKEHIEINRVSEKEVLFFNQPLYRLKNNSRNRLVMLTSNLVKSQSSREGLTDDFWNYIGRFISFVNDHVSDGESSVEDLSDYLIEDVTDFVSKLDYSYLNVLLSVDYSEVDYHNASIELFNVGLVGFTPFFKEFYREFKDSFKPSYKSDLKVSRGSALYGFVLDLQRAYDSNLKLGDSLLPSDSDEITIEV